ncbi:MAG: glycosyltransferase family 1 protein [Thermodesulfobacteriota bacterium]
MRIGINALYLLPGRVGGTEIYIRNLVRELVKRDLENEYVIFVNRESAGVFNGIAPSAEIVDCPVRASSRPLRILYEQFILPFQAKRRRLDILFSAGMAAPFICPVPSIVVVYDLQHVNQPENFPFLYRFFLNAIVYLSAKTSDAVVVISGRVKEDVVKHYGIPHERVHVVYIGMDPDFFSRVDSEKILAIRKKYSLPERFIFYPASSLPHKNHKRLLDALKILKDAGEDVKLLLTGARDYGCGEIEKKIKELGLEKDVIFLGWLPCEDIPAIYSASEALVYPSLHEGFGMPIVEAMAAGTPVVCSGIEPLGEVASDAALFVDPYDPKKIADAVMTVLNHGAARENLIKKGLKRAKEFTWKKTAENTLKIFESFAMRRP